jgi:hypothetical protein
MVVFPADTDGDCFRMLAHRAFCASAIFRRDAAEMIRVDRLDSMTPPVPLRDSIPEIGLASQFLSVLSCAFREAPEAHFVDSTLLPPRVFLMRPNCIGG